VLPTQIAIINEQLQWKKGTNKKQNGFEASREGKIKIALLLVIMALVCGCPPVSGTFCLVPIR